jgi:hypothetical protein
VTVQPTWGSLACLLTAAKRVTDEDNHFPDGFLRFFHRYYLPAVQGLHSNSHSSNNSNCNNSFYNSNYNSNCNNNYKNKVLEDRTTVAAVAVAAI